MAKKGFVHKIHKNLCKGCEICVHYCPKNVLEMNHDNKVVAKRPADCIGCHLCELRCPDFAIQVESCDFPDANNKKVTKKG